MKCGRGEASIFRLLSRSRQSRTTQELRAGCNAAPTSLGMSPAPSIKQRPIIPLRVCALPPLRLPSAPQELNPPPYPGWQCSRAPTCPGSRGASCRPRGEAAAPPPRRRTPCGRCGAARPTQAPAQSAALGAPPRGTPPPRAVHAAPPGPEGQGGEGGE